MSTKSEFVSISCPSPRRNLPRKWVDFSSPLRLPAAPWLLAARSAEPRRPRGKTDHRPVSHQNPPSTRRPRRTSWAGRHWPNLKAAGQPGPGTALRPHPARSLIGPWSPAETQTAELLAPNTARGGGLQLQCWRRGPGEAESPLWECRAAGTPQAFAGSPGTSQYGLPGQAVWGAGAWQPGRSWAWVRGLLKRPHPG